MKKKLVPKKRLSHSLDKPRNLGVRVFKVLKRGYYNRDDREVWTGGHSSFNWTPYLPVGDKPGKPCRLSTDKPLVQCSYGLHVTNQPVHWGARQSPTKDIRIFEAIVFGPTKGSLKPGYDNKICAYKIQLIREVYNEARHPRPNGEWEKITAYGYRGE